MTVVLHPADVWPLLRGEAEQAAAIDAAFALYSQRFQAYGSMASALSFRLADALGEPNFTAAQLAAIFLDCYKQHPELVQAAELDLQAVVERDPAPAGKYLPVFLFFKGYQALQAWRLGHILWQQNRKMLALYLQSRISIVFAVDIHPAAQIGTGIMLDHAHGLVIGETSVVDDNVSMLHNVTLGGTGKVGGDRHPKIRSGVMIGAGAKILGNIEVGSCARVAAGSVVLQNVPPHVTVAGSPAKIVGQSGCAQPAAEMDQMLPDAPTVK